MRGFLIAILVLGVVLLGGGLIAATAYQAGLSTAVTVVQPAAEGAGTVVVPVAGYGWGWHGFGFPFFGFFGFLLFLFLFFGLIRAIAGPRRGWGGGPGWGGPGRYGDGPNGHGGWESRAHDRFEQWHRESHGDSGPPSTPPTTGTGA